MSVSLLLPLDIAGPYMGPGPMMGHYSYNPIGGFLMFFLPLVVLLGLFLLLRRAERNGTPLFGTRGGWGGPGPGPQSHPHAHHHGPAGGWASPDDEALRTLNNRLASGDIDPEDSRQRVDTLRATRDRASDPTVGMPYLGPEDQPGRPEQQGPQA